MNAPKKYQSFLFFFFTLLVCSEYTIYAEHPRIRDGLLDISGWNFKKQGEITLAGEWKCLLNRDDLSFADPDYDDNSWEIYNIPGYWNKRTSTYKGTSWFRLKIYSGGRDKLCLYIHHANTSYELFINGKKMVSNGKPGKNKKSTIPRLGEKIIALPESPGITLAWRIANYHDPCGGPGVSPVIMRNEKIFSMVLKRNVITLVIIGFYLMLAMYHFFFWITNRKNRASLILTLCAFSVCIREVTANSVLENLFPGLSMFTLHWKLESVFTALVIFFFLWFCHFLYMGQFPKKIVWLVSGVIIILLLYIIIVPVLLLLSSLFYIQLLMLPFFIICIIVLTKAFKKGKKDALISIAGIALFLLCVVSDLIYSFAYEIVSGNTSINSNLIIFGFSIFVISQAVVLAVRTATVYKTASYLSRNLEQEVIKKTEQLAKQKKELEKVNIQLKELDQQKSLFYQNVTHELRTPLTLIMGPLESLVRGFFGPLKKEIKSQLGVMRRNAGRLLQYINQLLELSKLEAGKVKLERKPVDMGKVIHYVAAIFESSFKTKGIDLELHLPDRDCYVPGDKDKIEKIISNLLSNAFKFAEKKGKVILQLDMPSSDAYTISVKDTGCGIPEQFIPLLFERFKQADSSPTRKHEGSGIGLSLVKEYTELHGGTITVKSKEGEGSEFIITLPAGDNPPEIETTENGASIEPEIQQQMGTITEHDPENGTNQQLGQQEEDSRVSEEKILIVEDNPDMRAYISGFLKNCYRLFEAGDGREGLETAQAIQPDLIISDLMMPYMDGVELVHTIRRTRELAHIPIIILTARMADDPGTDELLVLADDFLSKPFHPRELLSSVKNLLELKSRRERLAFFDNEFMITGAEKNTIDEKNDEKYPGNPVLIIDDNEGTLKNFRQLLLHEGINHITVCNDSRKVMDILEKQTVSLVILDLKMPYIPGEELLKMIKKKYPQVDVLVVTGIDDIEMAVSCIREGAFNYLVKPIEMGLLLSDIKHILKIKALEDELNATGRQFATTDLENPDVFSEIITVNEKMKWIFIRLEAIAGSTRPILITGETGTGKDLLPAIIHTLSGRKGKLVKVNISGLDDTMFSDVLFGHKKGAYTGAIADRKGLIEQAESGTLFLDEIGDLATASQVKLLNLIENGEYYKLGSDTLIHCQTRIIAATNANLMKKIEQGFFRDDVYYRFTHPIQLPPLRERCEDIPLLTRYFMKKAADDLGKKDPAIPEQLIPLLQNYHFPGNIRELQRLIYEAMSRHREGKLSLQYFKEYIKANSPANTAFGAGQSLKPEFTLSFSVSFPTLKEIDARVIEMAMKKAANNQVLAAHLLGITPSALNKRLKKISPEE
ncbi:MAG: sigma 54-interacting transcriptional regulator [Spirochaetales bacterium]|nr:sigma 54-interacting transcriptional regulator [Spirochaetales bacterium]